MLHNESCQWNQFDLCVSLEPQIDNSSIVNATVTEVCLCVVFVCVCVCLCVCTYMLTHSMCMRVYICEPNGEVSTFLL